MTFTVKALQKTGPDAPFEVRTIERRDPRPDDVVIAIKAAGVGGVVAHSFARIFYRNAFNMGLAILECPAAATAIQAGDEIELDLARGLINNLTRNEEYQAHPVPPFMQQLLEAGGLMAYVTEKLQQAGEQA